MAAIPPDQAIKNALSAPRVGTYEAATAAMPNLPGALALYAWNAQISAAFMAPLHLCEVVLRNAVNDALTAVYGPLWPWDPTFELSLPNPQGPHFNARRELVRARTNQPTSGKVIAELKFKFWQTMFTGRFDTRIWNPHLRAVLPFLDQLLSVQQLRKAIFNDLEQLRTLRNRIAHHEPIFARSLASDFQQIQTLIGFRCPDTAAWMVQHQQAQALIGAKPP
ncbi:hypothetical protein [uncultured Ramlibacter sp.]|uniref:hypothetical protein n=1 Tax=uncultured Ramlibacter sp. TaxID=260755 RepID=UPI00261EBC11|nr:hypothetical protein [uncultured Ramlibacter sp.]